MGFRKAIRSLLQCPSSADLDRLERSISDPGKFEKQFKEQQARLDEVESEVAILRRRLQFAEASGTLESFDGVEPNPEATPAAITRQIQTYLDSRKLPRRITSLGDFSDFADLAEIRDHLEGIGTPPETKDTSSDAIGVVIVGRLDMAAFREDFTRLLRTNQFTDGMLAWLPTPRLGPELTRTLAEGGEEVGWLPWATGLPSGLWVILQRGRGERP